jgi:predicted MFS family arabinose efflux permease
MPALLAGRCVQGLGGGVLFALSYALIRVVFEAPLWPRAMALVSGMWGVATLGGPAIGGMFAQQGLWRPAFWVLLPVALLLALTVAAQFRGKAVAGKGSGPLPWPALSLLVLSVLAVCTASLSSSLAWNAVGMAAGIALAGLLMRVDGRSRQRLLPTGAYSLSAELGRLYALMALLVAALTTEIFVPYFLQQLHGMSPLAAGYMTALMAAGWTLAALFSAGRGPAAARRLIQASPAVVLAALLVLATTLPLTGWRHPWLAQALYCLALTAVGFGIGMCWPHLLTRVFSAALPGEETLASSSITTVQLYATAMAAALAGMVANAAGLGEPGGLQGARSAALALFGVFAVAPALALWLARPARPDTTG